MSDGPPEWFDQAPPPTGGPVAPNGRKQTSRQAPPAATPQDTTDFFDWLNAAGTRRDLIANLPDYMNVDQFIATAKDAALNNQKLLQPNLRPSLLRAISKAAKQGLRPDGKEGALVPRYDTSTKSYGIVWQPMVWGIVKLGRLTGAIESIRPVIVFKGEQFDIEEGDVQVYRHKVDRSIVGEAYQALYGGVSRNESGQATVKVNPEDFFKRVDCVYTIITPKAGLPVKRWMPRERIALIRSQQGLNTPWYGAFLDEMICKTSILHTAKHVDLDISNPATERFREAMQHDMEVDFESTSNRAAPGPGNVGLLGHETKLDVFENLTAPSDKAMANIDVEIDRREETQPKQSTPPEEGPPDDLEQRALSLVAAIEKRNRDTLIDLTSLPQYLALVERISKSRSDLMVKVRDACTAAIMRET